MSVPIPQRYVQGQGAVSADGLNTFIQGVSTAPQLRGFVGITGMAVYLYGIAFPNDGGGGLFQWNATSTAPDNNATIIVPNGTIKGAWILASSQSSSGALQFASYAAAQAASIPSGVTQIQTLGYYQAGDFGGAYYRLATGAAPTNLTTADGKLWTINEPVIDPRMFGAHANTWVFDDCTITSGLLNIANFSGQYTFTAADVGKSIVVWPSGRPYAASGATFRGTIAAINSTTQIRLSGNAPAAVSGGCGYFGSDDTTAIAAALAVVQTPYDFCGIL